MREWGEEAAEHEAYGQGPAGHENTSLRTCFRVWCERELKEDGWWTGEGRVGWQEMG